jgi:hypothetical protein
MDSARQLLLATLVAGTLVPGGGPAFAQGAAEEAFASRIEALALDVRCDLFSDDVAIALEAGAMLGRNALLRASWNDSEVAQLARRVDLGTDAMSCEGAQAADVLARVQDGFSAWRQVRGMTFPGDQRTWTARRQEAGEGWLLTQEVTDPSGARVVFGLARREDGEVRPALAMSAAERPRAARALVRDATLSPSRVEGELARLAGRAPDPLAAAAAPDVFTRAVWAAERSRPAPGSALATGFGGEVAVLWFPAAAIDDIAALDPREAMAIELDLGSRIGGEQLRRYYVEIGDFAPAALFVDPPAQRSPEAPPNPASRIR